MGKIFTSALKNTVVRVEIKVLLSLKEDIHTVDSFGERLIYYA